ncbi:allantoate deiminase [Azospirillum fermentarium]|uniref:allantoate amidohydrolase n=1 Tax=Azospirillum fermentarium TaxID=1233114 RepID=UPI002226321E|nr:allantoate amidohydrolase [Azospirillum fermentarium]MCW2248468.1 allantoate deiminase [Azospirillum fermentarium]
MSTPLDGATLLERADALAAITAGPGLTRLYLTDEHRRANALVGHWMAEAGMAVRTDAVGNIIGRYEGDAPGAPALLLGSHLDTVRDAGRYDGMLGVLTAIACVGDLHRRGRRLPCAVEVIGFGDEEGTRFQSTLIGSKAVAGMLDPAALAAVDAAGVTLARALTDWGLDPARIGDAARRPGEILAYAELHIEQGPVLESLDQPVGVVTAIAGAVRLSVTVGGTAGHAGTVPMGLRRDALAAAAEMVLAVEEECAARPPVVGTVGRIAAAPGAVNVIPGQTVFTVDLRSERDGDRDAALAATRARFDAIAARRGVTLAVTRTHAAPAVACSPALIAQMAGAAVAEGFTAQRLPSGAGHDAMAMAALCPVGMLFVRCRGGISHNPAESITAADAEAGARTLLRFIEGFRPAAA